MSLTQDDVIHAFLEHRNALLGTEYKMTSRPDEVDRTSKAVDAICESPGAKPLAIEHTRLETFQQQIRDDAWFTKAVAPVEALGPRYKPWWLSITFFYARGTAWGDSARLVNRMRDWLDAHIESIPLQKTGREMFDDEIAEVGMVRISKHKDSKRPGIYVARTVPGNVDFQEEAVEIMTKALDHKYDQLAEHQKNGTVSVLLIDSRDIALTNHIEQYKAFLRSCKATPRPGLEEVWLAEAFEGENESTIDLLCFHGEKEVMKRANAENFMLGPEYDAYWGEVLAKEDREGAK